MIELVFTKGTGKYDQLVIQKPDGSRQEISCPKQRIIPHDMVHYAVEKIFQAHGFLGRVKAGEAAVQKMSFEAVPEATERLVEVMQADFWSPGTDAQELITSFRIACDAHGHATVPLSKADIHAIRAEMQLLSDQWGSVPVGGTLRLRF